MPNYCAQSSIPAATRLRDRTDCSRTTEASSVPLHPNRRSHEQPEDGPSPGALLQQPSRTCGTKKGLWGELTAEWRKFAEEVDFRGKGLHDKLAVLSAHPAAQHQDAHGARLALGAQATGRRPLLPVLL